MSPFYNVARQDRPLPFFSVKIRGCGLRYLISLVCAALIKNCTVCICVCMLATPFMSLWLYSLHGMNEDSMKTAVMTVLVFVVAIANCKPRSVLVVGAFRL